MSRGTLRFDLRDPDLFGNDAAEEEKDDVFRSYAIRPEGTSTFWESDVPIAVARAYKGEGKSALLRITSNKIDEGGSSVVVNTTASRVTPAISSTDYMEWIREWKARIASIIATEVGKKIGIAWSDNAMSLVEEAEKQGARDRSFISTVLDRLPLGDLQMGDVQLAMFRRKTPGVANPEAAIKKWAEAKPPIWLLIDDIDKNFSSTDVQVMRVGAFFDAMRDLRLTIPQLRIRSTIRPNVWTVLKRKLESMSHVEQYMVDLRWSEESMKNLLAKRIEGYIDRTGQRIVLNQRVPDRFDRDIAIIALLFEDPMTWGRGLRPPHVVLHTLCKHRPRWLIELCKVGGKEAARRRSKSISRNDVLSDYDSFGRKRIDDMVAEFEDYCPEVGEVIDAFHRQSEEYATDELLSVIDRFILNHLNPRIEGVTGRVRARNVAAFLFEVGFIFARKDNADGSYKHFTFSEKPSLLRSRTALDQGLRWEVHPIFRQALEMRDSEGRQAKEW